MLDKEKTAIRHSIFDLSVNNSQIVLFTTLIAYQNSQNLLHNIKLQIWFPSIDSGGFKPVAFVYPFPCISIITCSSSTRHLKYDLCGPQQYKSLTSLPIHNRSSYSSVSLSLALALALSLLFPRHDLLLKLSKLVSVARVIYLRLNEIEYRLNSPRPDNSHNFIRRQAGQRETEKQTDWRADRACYDICIDLYIYS